MYEAIDQIIQRKREQTQTQSDDVHSSRRHAEIVSEIRSGRETMLNVVETLIKYLDNKTSKTEVVNQLKSINTPDALEVARAVHSLHKTLQDKPDVDLSEVTSVMKDMLAEVKAIPKETSELELPEEFTIKNQVDYSGDFKALLEAVKAIKLVAKAPDVHLPAPDVHVAATDLTPLEKATKAVEKAIKGLTIPEPANMGEVEKLLQKANKLLKEIADKPVAAGGGGGGGRVSPFSDTNNMPSFVNLQQGALPTIAAAVALRIDTAATPITYVGVAAPGTATSAATWQIKKIDETTGTITTFADGNASFDNVWDNRASLTYS